MKSIFLAMAVALLAVSGTVSAVDTTFDVTLTIDPNCTVDTVPTLDFGAATFLTADVTAETGITVNCTKGTIATIALSGTAGARTMSNGIDTIAYDLYQDAAYGTDWDATSTQDVEGAGVDNSGVSLDPTATTRTIYGKVPAQATGSTGDYSATVTATVTF